jgi:glycosyltransferase involved in cell wall biosynthesis
MKVSIITPTTGNPFLKDCIESVRAQTYKNIEHIIVVDGQERYQKLDPQLVMSLYAPNESEIKHHIITLPYPTGTNRYNGHRIYGAATYIADGDYHLWLDDDNMLEPTHVESLVNLVMEKKLHWAYSFRKIIDKDNNELCLDDCESLGKWASILNPQDYFVDVNCYFVAKNVAVMISPIWYRKFREPGQMEIDRAIAHVLMHPDNKMNFDCTRDYTVRYRVGNTDLSVKADFFLQGNQKMLERHNGNLPWKSKE